MLFQSILKPIHMSELPLCQIRLSLLIYYLHKKPILSVFSIIVQDEIRLYRDEKNDGINSRTCTVIRYSRVGAYLVLTYELVL